MNVNHFFCSWCLYCAIVVS